VFTNFTFTLISVSCALQVSTEERLTLLKKRPQPGSNDNIWKWADALVNKDLLINIMTRFYTHLHEHASSPTVSDVSAPRQ